MTVAQIFCSWVGFTAYVLQKEKVRSAVHRKYILFQCNVTSWKQNPHYHMLYVYYRTFLPIRFVLKLPTLYNAKYFRLGSKVEPIIGI
jgi:hypothetical protein